MSTSDKQKQYIREADKRWNIKVGAVRSGKTFIDTLFVIPERIRQVRDKPGLIAIFGVSSSTIERNVLQPMREHYSDVLVGGIATTRGTAKIFGQEVYCIGTEKANSVSKIQGMSIKYAYGDEIAKWSPDAFAMIESRLDKEYSRFDGTCNPEGPNHWLKKWLDNPKLNAYIQKYVLFDNPFLPQSYIEALCNEYEGTVYYDRYILGEWALAEGLIYPMHKVAIGSVPAGVDFVDYVLSIDYGTENAFAGILWGKGTDNVWYAFKEYYYSGRTSGIPKTDDEYADDMENFCAPVLEQYEEDFAAAVAMNDVFASRKKLTTIVDPSAASFIATLQKRKGFKVRKANNDVLDGIRETAVAMRRGLIKIDPGMKNTISELEGYIWDEKHAEIGEDKPVKVKDHACDSIRYFVKTMYIVKKSNNSIDFGNSKSDE